MESTYTILALITAGISVALGVISSAIGLTQEKSREFLFFAALSFSLTIFFLLPPVGFITHDVAPYSSQILFKRIFIYGFYALIPFFITSYTGYKNYTGAYLISAIMAIDYLIMMTTKVDSGTPGWYMLALVIFLLVIVYGIYLGVWQMKNDNRGYARLLLISLSFFAVLFMSTVVHQFYGINVQAFGKGKLFFPQHFVVFAFAIIMGIRLIESVYDKNRLKKYLRIKNANWDEFMRNAPLLVLELDAFGQVLFANKHALRLLDCENLEKIKGTNWFEKFICNKDKKFTKDYCKDLFEGNTQNHVINYVVLSRNGQKLNINWVKYVIFSDQGEPTAIMCVGRDITKEEIKSEQILKLSLELEKEKLVIEGRTDLVTSEFLGKSVGIRYVLQKVDVVASTQVPVLIEGETGVGKEMVADLIYKNSLRSDKPFIKVNCGAFPKDLIEDELFGHEKGAFTSAIQLRKGRFELADGGTIFLDEIGELPIDLQPRLLRVLQDGQFERIGGQTTIKVNVRVIAATNRNLYHEIRNGRFREDLFYRLNVFPIMVPPLRGRREDQKIMIDHFIAFYCKLYERNLLDISKADMQRLLQYDWPGNVRELKNIIERSVLTSVGPTLRIEWLLNENGLQDSPKPKSLINVERLHITKILEECKWRINGEAGAAEMLKMHPNTLRSKMKKLGIERPD